MQNFQRNLAYFHISHANLYKLQGIDWTKDHRIAEGSLSHKALRLHLLENGLKNWARIWKRGWKRETSFSAL